MPTNSYKINPKATKSIHYTLYYGTFIHTPDLTTLEINFNTLVGVNEQGTIDFIHKDYDASLYNNKSPIQFFIDQREHHHSQPHQENHGQQRYQHFEFVDYSHDLTKFFIPGFIDTHIHASQFPNIGIGLGTPLLDWLKKYTFPLENHFCQSGQEQQQEQEQEQETKLQFADEIYNQIIQRTLENGTTCASYFTTIDPETTNLFAELLLINGQRGFVGKVCMDHNEPYQEYQESIEDCEKSMHKIINHIEKLNPNTNKNLVTPIITPRFAPVCSDKILKFLGELSHEKNLPIQTHISENKQEIELVDKLFPDCENYASVYNKFNLLTNKTILAHAIHLTPKECQLIKLKNCSISHCPTSNTFLSSGEAPIYKYLYHDNINVSLGTDVSGGFDYSILQIIKHAILVSHHLNMHKSNTTTNTTTKNDVDERLSIKDGIYMATMGGAKAVGLQDIIGSFEIGKQFDVQLIDLLTRQINSHYHSHNHSHNHNHNHNHNYNYNYTIPTVSDNSSRIDIFNWQYPVNKDLDKMKDLLGKWIFNGDDRNCIKVWCNGRLVINKEKYNHRDDRWVITNSNGHNSDRFTTNTNTNTTTNTATDTATTTQMNGNQDNWEYV